MQPSLYRRTLPKLTFILAALLVGAFLSKSDTTVVHAAGSFNATTSVTLSSNALNAAADSTVFLTIPGGDYNFSLVANGTPAAAFLAPGPGNPGFIGGTHPALGDTVGTLSSSTFLGLTNNACNTNLTVTFTFINATVDNSPGNTIDAL